MTTNNDTPIFTEEQARYLKEALLLELQSEQIVKRYDENPTQGNLEAATTILSKMGVYVPYLTGIINALRADVDAANARAQAAERERDAQEERAKSLEMDLFGIISSAKSYLNGVNSMISPSALRKQLDEVEWKLFEQSATAQPADGSAAEETRALKPGDNIAVYLENPSPLRAQFHNRNGIVQAEFKDRELPTKYRVMFEDETWAEFERHELILI